MLGLASAFDERNEKEIRDGENDGEKERRMPTQS